MKYFIPAFLCTILVLWLSVMSGVNLPEPLQDLFSLDKLGHVIAYGVLASTYFWGTLKNRGVLKNNHLIIIALAVAAYGILMEIIQYSFFPHRYFEVLDILANIMGIIISYLIFKHIYKT